MTYLRLHPHAAHTEVRLAALRAALPEAFVGGTPDWSVIRELAGAGQEESSEEHYGLTWPGKNAARRATTEPTHATLLPRPGQGRNEQQTGNIFIAGDNLIALKLLQKSYAGRIKLIYIDPPYNTGQDFVYRDNYRDTTTAYLRRTGQADASGALLVSNTRADGRFHSNWLNMMLPRLTLARSLLRSDGMILVSIDDNEVHNLRLLMNEVFGEENFITQFVWNSSTAGGLRAKHVNQNHEYALCYAKDITSLPMLYAPLSDEAVGQYRRSGGRGPYREKDFAWATNSNNANQRYLVQCPDGSYVQPRPGCLFRFVRESFDKALADDLVVFKQTETSPLIDENGQPARWNIYIKKYLGDAQGAPSSLIPKSVVGLSNIGTEEIKRLFDGATVFDNPKSTRYLSYLLTVGMDSNDIVLDFFAGSGSTAHTVYALNAADGGDRRWILVQLDEQTPAGSTAATLGYATIAELAQERIRRAAATLESPTVTSDLGFRVYEIAPSNFREWEALANPDQLQAAFDAFESPLAPGWMVDGLLTEVMLLQGYPLDSRTERAEEIEHNVVYKITGPESERSLWVCLDDELHAETVAELAALDATTTVVCLDQALHDQDKLHLADCVALYTI